VVPDLRGVVEDLALRGPHELLVGLADERAVVLRERVEVVHVGRVVLAVVELEGLGRGMGPGPVLGVGELGER